MEEFEMIFSYIPLVSPLVTEKLSLLENLLHIIHEWSAVAVGRAFNYVEILPSEELSYHSSADRMIAIC
jgi:hypothetical protein